MPRKKDLSYDETNKRWRIMYRGERYVRSCRQLSCPEGKAASQTAANLWWAKKRAEIDGDAVQWVEKYRETLGQLLQAHALHAIEEAEFDLMDKLIAHPHGDTLIPIVADEIQIAEAKTTLVQTPKDQTIGHYWTQWRALELSKKVKRKKANVRAVEIFVDWVKPQTALIDIKETIVQGFFSYLQGEGWEDNYKAKIWQTFKRFVTNMAEDKLILLPSNLKSNRFRFKTIYGAPQHWEVADIHKLLSLCDERERLWVLLCLNCGWRQVDIGTLKDNMVDWVNGTITSQRGKLVQSEVKNVPQVTYYLWDDTLELLKKYRSGQELVFVDAENKPLYIDGQKDYIGYRLNKVRHKGKFKREISQLRATASNKIDNSPYGRYAHYFLGESPSGTASKHYNEPRSHEDFGEWRKALLLLRSKLNFA